MQISKYEIVCIIGKDAYGVEYKSRNKENNEFVPFYRAKSNRNMYQYALAFRVVIEVSAAIGFQFSKFCRSSCSRLRGRQLCQSGS